jgi:glycosyltransferase involved in cell wall biosynthesis
MTAASKRPTRIVQVCSDPGVPWGGTKGASVHLAELAAALAAAGAEVLVAVTRIDHDRTPPGVRVAQLPGPRRGASLGDRLAADPDRGAWLAGVCRDFGAEVVYERFALHTAAGATAAAAAGLPHLVELNAPLPVEAATYRRLDEPEIARRLEQSVLSSAACVLAVSRPVAAYAAQRGARRVLVLPNAVDPARFPNAADAGAAPPTAVFVGTLRPWHGVDSLADAWRLLGAAAPRLLVVGDGPGRDRLEAVGAEVTGAVPHQLVVEHLAACQIGLAPYPGDGPAYFSPLKLFEYLAAGLATVAAALPGVVDVVDDTGCVVVPRGDVDALAAAVAALAADPSRRRALGASARATVADRHTWAHRAARILDLAAELPRRLAAGVAS